MLDRFVIGLRGCAWTWTCDVICGASHWRRLDIGAHLMRAPAVIRVPGSRDAYQVRCEFKLRPCRVGSCRNSNRDGYGREADDRINAGIEGKR